MLLFSKECKDHYLATKDTILLNIKEVVQGGRVTEAKEVTAQLSMVAEGEETLGRGLVLE